MDAKELLLDFFDGIIKQIEVLNYTDIKKLESGEFSLGIKIIKKKKTSSLEDILSKEDISILTEKLKMCDSRELGYEILAAHLKNRKQLEAFAKEIDVFVMKQDKVDRIKEKIIEGTIGATLRSNAIQGNKT